VGGAGTHAAALEAIRLVREKGPGIRIGINYLITKGNFRNMPEMLAFAEGIGAHQIKFAPIHANLLHRLKDPAAYDELVFGPEDLPALEAELDAAADPFNMAVRLAIAGNIIDLGPNLHLSEAHIRESLEQSLATPLDGDSDAFRREIDAAREILYLADNAGEIYFDRPLLKRLPEGRVTVAVRGLPVLNDATLKDAREAGLHELARLMDNGSDAPGTVIEDCHDAFRAAFESADLLIAKGQGNFETLIGCGRPVWYLFKAKCAVVAREVGKPLNTHLLMREPQG